MERTRMTPARVWMVLGFVLGAAVAVACSAGVLTRDSAGEAPMSALSERNAETAAMLAAMGGGR